ncbi:MAG TPA: AAA family ATPase [Gemmatimonadaceae bacterium]|nr:AAA family ATPase [Gemmatimonadaceae bacterium]
MTPEEIAETARCRKYEADVRQRAHLKRIDRDAKKLLDAEIAAQRPAPKLVFDGEEDWRPTDWLIDGIIPAQGAGQLFGESDVGKTFVALHMCIHICADLPWNGRGVGAGSVLFIEAEGTRSFQLRKHAAKVEAGVEASILTPFPFITIYEVLGFGPDTSVDLVLSRAAGVRTEVAARGLPPIRLAVVDTLAQNMQGDADSNADMTAFLTRFRTFTRALSDEPVFGLLIHHPGHAEKTRGRGAYALPADLDLIMRLEGTPDGLTLHCDRMRDDVRFAPIPLALETRLVTQNDGRTASTLVVVSRSETSASYAESHEARIVKHLRTHPRQTTAQIAMDLHIGKSVVVKKVDSLCEDGLLCRVDVKGRTGQTKQLYEVAARAADGLPEAAV